MAVTTNANMQVYNEEYHTSMIETLQQETAVFNEGSRGAINLIDQASIGHFRKSSFFTEMAHLGRRVTTDVGAKVPTNLQAGERVSAKLHRSFMVDTTRDAFRKIGADMSLFSSLLGEQVGKEKAVDYLDTALLTCRTNLQTQALVNHVAVAGITHTELASTLQLFGDQSSRIKAWVMHSASFYGLMKQAIADKVFEVAGVTINTASVASLNRPIIVSDSQSLVDGANYKVLGLVEGAINVLQTEDDDIVSEPVTGFGNLIQRVQGEHGYNVECRGFSWIEASGPNPDDAALAVAANYAQFATDKKMLPGVMLTHAA